MGKRSAFTLIELLVSMSILLILATLTFRLVGTTLDSDRIRTGSRELQSYLSGARDRAIYAGQPRGVRLIPDQTDPTTVRSFVYIGAPTDYTDGNTITIAADGSITFNPAIDTLAAWRNLWSRGLLSQGAQIQLRQGTTDIGLYLAVSPKILGPPPSNFFVTAVPGAGVFPIANATYKLQLAPAVLPNEEPRTLPQGVVVDLDISVRPNAWGGPPAGYASRLDVLYSPRGTVIGSSASAGRIHFVLADQGDSVNDVPLLDAGSVWKPSIPYAAGAWVAPTILNDRAFRVFTAGTSAGGEPAAFANAVAGQTIVDGTVTWQCFIPKPRLIVSLATQTGRVTTHPVHVADAFRYAETGEVTQ